MVQLSKHADYGMIMMAYFAKHPKEALISARELSLAVSLPLPTVTKLLKQLAKAKLLHSTLGAHGGYTLGKELSHISVADVIEAIDGVFALTECSLDTPGVCKTESACNVKHHWVMINHAVRNALSHLPLSMMISSQKELRTVLPQFPNDLRKVS